jgi:hypothetical protein
VDTGGRNWPRTLAITVNCAVIFALAAYAFTSTAASSCNVLGGIGIEVVSCPGFDAWTGEPHGLTVKYNAVPGLHEAVPPKTDDVPADMRDMRAIPLPVGFTIGLFLTIGVLQAARLRRTAPIQATA